MDVLGLPVGEARRRLAAAALGVRVVETSPPRGPLSRGSCRVVRQRFLAADEVELVVARFPVVAAGPLPSSTEAEGSLP